MRDFSDAIELMLAIETPLMTRGVGSARTRRAILAREVKFGQTDRRM